MVIKLLIGSGEMYMHVGDHQADSWTHLDSFKDTINCKDYQNFCLHLVLFRMVKFCPDDSKPWHSHCSIRVLYMDRSVICLRSFHIVSAVE